jgi:hypothetical protein
MTYDTGTVPLGARLSLPLKIAPGVLRFRVHPESEHRGSDLERDELDHEWHEHVLERDELDHEWHEHDLERDELD